MKPTETIQKSIMNAAQAGILTQNDMGSMPSGRNGPWNHLQTPVRNTSHWSIIFSYAYHISSNDKYEKATKNCINYILRKNSRPHGKSFKHRIQKEHNKCNGLIGQAWTIEGLAVSGELIGHKEAQSIAKEVFHLHPFDFRRGLWNAIEIDGEILPTHGVINQQIWFAAAGSILSSQGDIKASEKVSCFLDQLNKNLDVYSSGLIKHNGCQHGNKIKRAVWRMLTQNKTRNKILSEGYHSFNLYGLSLLRQNHPKHSFWESKKFKSIVKYTNSIEYKNAIVQNPYTYGYNPTGIEVAFFIKTIPNSPGWKINNWLQEQINRTFDCQKELMKVGPDQDTLLARTYECIRVIGD